MSRTLTNSFALIEKFKSEVENPSNPPPKVTDIKTYGSIKRSHPPTNFHNTQNTQLPVRSYEPNQQHSLRDKFEEDFKSLEQDIYDIFDKAKDYKY